MKICLILICALSILACKPENKTVSHVLDDKAIGTMHFPKLISQLVDSFALNLKPSTHIPGIIGYIRIKESSNNRDFKIQMEGVEAQSLFDTLNVDNYFIHRGVVFCVDYNLSNVISDQQLISKTEIKNKSKLAKSRIDVRMPSWIFQLSNDKIVKINKFAQSMFAPPSMALLPTDDGLKSYEVNEWGDIIDEQGKIIGQFKE